MRLGTFPRRKCENYRVNPTRSIVPLYLDLFDQRPQSQGGFGLRRSTLFDHHPNLPGYPIYLDHPYQNQKSALAGRSHSAPTSRRSLGRLVAVGGQIHCQN